ncbi:unknown [Fusobacterium sp. CAG:439]|nr:unknown [Fusobacterium sp. CAG:439]
MKKALKLLFVLSLMVSATGCNQYIRTQNTSDGHIYYGAYNRRDMIHADVKLFQKGTKKECDGVVFLNAPSRSITLKNDRVSAKMKLGCNDGSLMDIDWQLRKGSFKDGFGEGKDQLNNVYKFTTMPKSEFNILNEGHKIEFAKENSLLKY